jgi:hypothetical protein
MKKGQLAEKQNKKWEHALEVPRGKQKKKKTLAPPAGKARNFSSATLVQSFFSLYIADTDPNFIIPRPRCIYPLDILFPQPTRYIQSVSRGGQIDMISVANRIEWLAHIRSASLGPHVFFIIFPPIKTTLTRILRVDAFVSLS